MQLVATPLNPIPYGATVAKVPGDGPALRCAIWPESGPAAGTVCVFPGRAEYIERYFETVADLRRRRYAVVALDWRGQGGSERLLPDPMKGHIATFKHYEADAMRLLETLVVGHLPRPYIGLAHSMGGNVLLRLGARNDCPFDRIVLSAPMIAIHPKRLGVPQTVALSFAQSMRGIGLGARYVPGGGPNSFESMTFDDNVLTHDRTRFDRNIEISEIAPELSVGDPTIAWLGAALSSSRELTHPEHARRVRVPTLVCVAERDRIVSTPVSERYCDALPIGRCLSMPTAEHEVLQETDPIRARFFSAFDAFMTQDAVAA